MGISKNQWKVRIGLSRDSDGDVAKKGRRVQGGTYRNRRFSKPPVPFDDFKSALDRFEALMAEALHGDRRITANKSKVRAEVVGNYELVGVYVQHVAGDDEDPADILSSGYDLFSTSYAEPKPLDQPSIREVRQGKSGELRVMLKTVGRDAKYYVLRHGPQDDNGVVDKWTDMNVTKDVSYGVPLTGLKPGTTYVFQVCAQGKLGMTDWSDPYTKMCT
jgi:hypothetical protein